VLWRTLRTFALRLGGVPAWAGTPPDPLPDSPWTFRPADPEPDRATLGAVGAAVALAPLVNPKLPGHSGPVDVVILAGVCAVVAWALRTRVTVRLPYAIAMAGLMITGLVAGLLSPYPSDGLIAVLQEIFLLVWSAALATVCRTPRALGFLLRAWAGGALVWAVLLVGTEVLRIRTIFGTAQFGPSSDGTGTRAQLFLDQPNMAGNYFAIAVFVILATGWPCRWWSRSGAILLLLAAVFLTGSNAALVGLLSGGVLTLFLHVRSRAGLIKATAITATTIAVLGTAVAAALPALVSYAEQSSDSLLQNSLARGPRSAAARQSLFAWQFKLYEQGDLIGIGPNGTQQALGAEAAPAVKEAHNDYLGTLVERGPLGLAALSLLVASVIARSTVLAGRAPPRLRPVLPMPAALAGACAAFAVTGLAHEILHYRWLWTMLGVVAAVHLLARRDRSAGEVGASGVLVAANRVD